MGAFEDLVQREIDKRLAKSTLISTAPCRVIEVLDDEKYLVQLITNNSKIKLTNYSGSPLEVGENAQVFYRGDIITQQSAYIGASLTKGGDGGKDVYILGTKTLGSLTVAEKTFCNVAVKALKETTITLGFNANILGLTNGDYVFKFYVDSEQYDYVVKGNDVADKYENCNVILPISLTIGEHIVEINGSGSGTVEDLKAFVSGQDITNGNVTIRQKADYTPFNFESLSTTLIDWSITGSAGGAGKVGKNKLKQKTTPIPNGAVGTIETDSGWYTESTAHQGITFTTGDNIIKGSLTIRHSDNSDISASSQIGDIMLVEGSTIPSVYDADTNLYSGTINQGYYTDEESGVRVRELGYSQSMATTVSISIRCCSDYFSLKPNTTYSVRLFNSAYNDIQFVVNTYSASGTITPKFRAVGGKSIPENGTFVTDTEQWIELICSHKRTKEYEIALPFDMRPMEYEYCESFADLKAGTYKLMIDIWGNNRWYAGSSTGYEIGFQSYTGCTADNWDWDGTNLTEWFTLLSEDNTAIISKTDILEAGTSRYKAQNAGAPFPNYYHREFTFTLSEDTKVGLFHRAYYESPTQDYPPYFRFMIVDSDVEAEAFATTGVSPEDMAGYSAWEKYQVTLPVTISCGDETQTITFDLGDEILYEGDSISKTSTGIELPTYVGLNTITTDSENQPFVYIKYMGL